MVDDNNARKIKRKHSNNGCNMPMMANCEPLPYGCVWSAADWSCAYDAFFMVFFFIHHSSGEFWTNSWSTYSPLAFVLHNYFSRLSSEYTHGLQPQFDQYRDQIRDILSDQQPNIFPRHGPAAIDVSDIFEQLNWNSEHGHMMSIQRTCSHCNQEFPPVSLHLPTTIHPAMLPCPTNHPVSTANTLTIQESINTMINTAVKDEYFNIHCAQCSSGLQNTEISLPPSPYLHFDVPPDGSHSILPSHTLNFSNENTGNNYYRLRGIIYHGNLHFTARLITMDHGTWSYDGQHNGGIPIKDTVKADDESELTTLQGRRAYIYVYQRIDHENI